MKIIKLFLTSFLLANSIALGVTRNCSVYGAGDVFGVEAGLTPIDRLDIGLAYQGSLDPIDTSHSRVTDHYYGELSRYPFLQIESILPKIPIEGQAYAGGRLMYRINTNDWFVSPGVGVEVEVTDKINFRTEWLYSVRDQIYDGENLIAFGFIARTK